MGIGYRTVDLERMEGGRERGGGEEEENIGDILSYSLSPYFISYDQLLGTDNYHNILHHGSGYKFLVI